MTRAGARFRALQRRAPVLQLLAVGALFAYGSATVVGFGQEQSIRSILVLAALLGIAAAGQTLVLLIGALDLSVPGLIALGAVVITELYGAKGWPLIPALLVVFMLCAAVGAAVGWLCHRYRLVPLVLTLGVSTAALGAIQVWTNSQVTGAPPPLLSELTRVNGTTLGLPISPVVVIWAVLALAITLFLYKAVAGRRLYATGANPRAADLALVRTRRVWVGVFLTSALLSGLTGVLLAGFAGAEPSLGDPYLFIGLTAVIVGGTAFRGVRGDYLHTVVGALLLTELTTIMVGHGYDTADQQIIFGVLILAVVAGSGRDRALRDRV